MNKNIFMVVYGNSYIRRYAYIITFPYWTMLWTQTNTSARMWKYYSALGIHRTYQLTDKSQQTRFKNKKKQKHKCFLPDLANLSDKSSQQNNLTKLAKYHGNSGNLFYLFAHVCMVSYLNSTFCRILYDVSVLLNFYQ